MTCDHSEGLHSSPSKAPRRPHAFMQCSVKPSREEAEQGPVPQGFLQCKPSAKTAACRDPGEGDGRQGRPLASLQMQTNRSDRDKQRFRTPKPKETCLKPQTSNLEPSAPTPNPKPLIANSRKPPNPKPSTRYQPPKPYINPEPTSDEPQASMQP